jgi:hypothetical protein
VRKRRGCAVSGVVFLAPGTDGGASRSRKSSRKSQAPAMRRGAVSIYLPDVCHVTHRGISKSRRADLTNRVKLTLTHALGAYRTIGIETR